MNRRRTLKLIRGVFGALAWLLNIEGAWSYMRARLHFITSDERGKK